MEAFIPTLKNPHLRDRLYRAIRARSPFRQFRDALEAYPMERERWVAFSDARQRQRAVDWLAEEGIEPI